MTNPNPITAYWLAHYAGPACALCGGPGVLNGHRDRLQFCICPNGQAYREARDAGLTDNPRSRSIPEPVAVHVPLAGVEGETNIAVAVIIKDDSVAAVVAFHPKLIGQKFATVNYDLEGVEWDEGNVRLISEFDEETGAKIAEDHALVEFSTIEPGFMTPPDLAPVILHDDGKAS